MTGADPNSLPERVLNTLSGTHLLLSNSLKPETQWYYKASYGAIRRRNKPDPSLPKNK